MIKRVQRIRARTIKKGVAGLLILAMLMSLMPLQAIAGEGVLGGGSAGQEVTVAATVYGPNTVINIQDGNAQTGAFVGCTSLNEVVFEDGENSVTLGEGAEVIHEGKVGTDGAPWRLYDDGTLVVDEGTIHWTHVTQSPWHAVRSNIQRIVFTGTITAGSSLQNLFRSLSNVTAIEGLSYFDTSNVTNMSYMFNGAGALTSLDLSGFDTSNVTTMSQMFNGASGLANLNLSGWNTGNVTDMSFMFQNASGLTSLDVSGFNTSNVTTMNQMFGGASGLTSLDVSGFNTSSVTIMTSMFSRTSGLTHLDLSGFDTSNVTAMGSMFGNASSLISLDLSSFDTGKVTNMMLMFQNTSSLRELGLGENFKFGGNPALPAVAETGVYTGYWQNVGAGTTDNPQGSHAFTSAQLMAADNAEAVAGDTWVWQKQAASADKSELEELVGEAKLRVEADYTPASWAAFAAALASAEDVLAAPGATQDDVDAAMSALETALDALVLAEPAPGVDKSALQTGVEAAKLLTEADYTPASWAAFAGALASAEDVLSSQDASQSEVDEAAAALQNAMDGLIPRDHGHAAPFGYLSNVEIRLSFYTGGVYDGSMWMINEAGEIVDFEFDPAVTEYDIVLPVDFTPYFAAWADNEYTGLSGRFLHNGTVIHGGNFYFLTNEYRPDNSAVFNPSDFTIDSPVRSVVMQVGFLRPGTGAVGSATAIFDDVDEYAFNIHKIARTDSLGVFTVPTGGGALPLTPEYVTAYANNSWLLSDFTVITEADILYLNAPPVPTDTNSITLEFRAPDGTWAEGRDTDGNPIARPSEARYKLDLSGYTPGADGSVTVPFRLRYTGPGDTLDREYTLNVLRYDVTPVFSLQPVEQSGTFEKNALPTFTAEVEPVPGDHAPQGVVTYQWYGTRTAAAQTSSYNKTSIAGATSPAFTLPPDIQAGEVWLSCIATRMVGNASYSTQSDLVRVNVNMTYLSGAQFIKPPAPPAGYIFRNTVNVGQSPGSIDAAFWVSSYKIPSGTLGETEEGGLISADLYRRPAGDPDAELEWVAALRNTGSGGSRQSMYGRSQSTNSVPVPASPTAGTYAYYVMAAVTMEGHEPVITTSGPAATVTFTMPDIVIDLEGSGTAEDPYLIQNLSDLETVRDLVGSGVSLSGNHLALTTDLTLPADWVPIGAGLPDRGPSLLPFSATLDGRGHTFTHPHGSRPLIKYARGATVKNLNIAGTYIAGYGLVESYVVDYGPNGDYWSWSTTGIGTIDIINVTIKSGLTVRDSGFIGGYASGINRVNILNCTVEEGVRIGCDADGGVTPLDGSAHMSTGSLAGDFNGTVVNSVSYATVYGTDNVGGLVGQKGQSMGPCDVTNSAFHGEIIATGNWVGGIIGRGYSSAQNTPAVSIENCFVTGSISGGNNVGGIFGGEPVLLQCWDNGIGYIRNNHFAGTIVSSGTNVGGVIGYMNSLNRYNVISNNYYQEGCGADKGIGGVNIVDTSFANPAGNADFKNSSIAGHGLGRDNHNRTDDPLGTDADKLAKSATAGQMKDGTITALLNSGENSYGNWIQGDSHPVLSSEPVAYLMTLSGEYKTQYVVGEDFSAEGMIITLTYTDGTSRTINPADAVITGYDKNTRGVQTITVKYGAAEASYTVRVLYDDSTPTTITVYFTLLGAEIHHGDGPTQTLRGGNLETWIPEKAYTVSQNATVWDVFQTALSEADPDTEGVFTWRNPSGNYIEAIYKDGVELAEFTNGNLSGWMYTLNGKHPNLGVSQQYLESNDVIVFHYTDDYIQDGFGQGSEDGFSIERVGEGGFELGADARVILKITNNNPEPRPATLIVCLYDNERHGLVNYSYLFRTLAAGEEVELAGGFRILETGDYSVKALVWDTFENMEPLLEDPLVMEVN